MKEELLLLRNQLKMGHRISFAEAMLLQRAIDILVNNAGKSPVIDIDPASGPDRTVEVRYVAPPGYVVVPKEPTAEMIAAAMNCDDVLFNSDESFCVQFGNIYEAILAAAPHSPGSEPATVPGKWIPVSERMPESNGVYFGWDGKRVLEVYCFFGGFSANQFIHGEITHWMPLPAAPQEAKP
ncbi:TPA: DUF551 domain-containing protein [Klebsiella variicola subsp. variicola]|nr:DUF551 domain-containing protein [Klebsiella variicola subsp. variicola]